MRSFLLAAAIALAAAFPAAAQDLKIGFVSTERVLREAAPSVRAEKKLEAEFLKRDQELGKLAEQLKRMQQDLDRNAMTMPESQRRGKEREFADMNREFQRKQREYREDLNQRRNEELARVIEHANKVINQIAEREKYDLILQDAVYRNPSIDITDKVIKAMDSAKPPAK